MVTLETKRKDTRKHIASVRGYIGEIVFNLQRRSLAHDQSKLEEPEVDGFYEMAQELKLSDTTYGSDEYRAILKKYKASTIQHHYQHNSHHPEFWTNGIRDMSLLDIAEMIADWRAATERMKDGDIIRSIEVNQERFGYSDELKSILINTVRELEWGSRQAT